MKIHISVKLQWQGLRNNKAWLDVSVFRKQGWEDLSGGSRVLVSMKQEGEAMMFSFTSGLITPENFLLLNACMQLPEC